MSELPVAHEAEEAVLGGILRAGKIPTDVETLLQPGDFYSPHLGDVYEACLTLSRAGLPIDPLAVFYKLDAATQRVVGAPHDMLGWSDLSTASGSMEYHAQLVAEHAERRRYLQAAVKIAEAARSGTDDLASLARDAIDSVPRASAHESESVWDVLASIVDGEDAEPGIPYGFPDLDEVLNPMTPGTMTAIGARSGVGKSTLAVDFLRNVAYRHGRKALMISIEMDRREVYSRILAAEARIKSSTILKRLPRTPEEENREKQAIMLIGEDQLVVETFAAPSVADVRAAVRRHKPDVVVVDYIGRMQLPKADRHDLALAEVSHGLVNIAKTEQCHMIVLTQFNRSGDQRTDKRPVIGDLRDSPALEHDSHVVLLLHRPDKHDPDDRPGEVDVIVAKQRSGKADVTIPLAAQLHYSRFSSLAWTPSAASDTTAPNRSH